VIRILFVDHAQALGGAEYSLLLLLEHLDRRRFNPVLACNKGRLAEQARSLDVQVVIVPMPRLRKTLAAPIRLGRGVATLVRVIRRSGIDLVHSNTMRASFYAALAARCARCPLLWHVRDIYEPGAYVRWMSGRSAGIIATSMATAEALPDGVSLAIVPNGVDLGAFDRHYGNGDTVRRGWGVSLSAPLVGIVGRLRPWKGQGAFIRAMAVVRQAHPQARYVVIGGTVFEGGKDYGEELVTLAEDIGLGDSLVFAGQRDDLVAVLSALDVMVHCSISPEPFGRVMIEGMAARLPIVAYDQGGASEIVVAGETGLLVPPGEVRALGKAVVTLLDDRELARCLGDAGRRRVEQHYDVRSLTRRIEDVIASCATRGEGS